MFESKNIYGEQLQTCSCEPLTGFFRDGYCNTSDEDRGMHTVCCVMTDEFLQFSKSRGNDLTTPMEQFQFKGLKAGDHWCLCAARWLEAYEAGVAPLVNLKATHEECLALIPLKALKSKEWNASS